MDATGILGFLFSQFLESATPWAGGAYSFSW